MSKEKNKAWLFFLLFLLLSMIGVESANCEMVAGCHCFKQRSYDPEDRFAADDYILATSFNSLMANRFNIPKRQIIMLKMKGGIQQHDLLIALKISQDFGIDLEKIVGHHQQHHSWQTIDADFTTLAKDRDNEFLTMIRAGRPVVELGQTVADEMIADFYEMPLKTVASFRQKGLNEKEITLLFLLACKQRTQPEDILVQVKHHGQSWSETAHKFGISPAMAGQLIADSST